MTCNYCGCEESSIIAEYTRLERNNIRQCRNCGLVYLEVNKSRQEIESYYSSDYRQNPAHQRLSADEHFHDRVQKNDASERSLFITENLDIRGKRILEIGSATGALLVKLREYGCKETIGIELTEEYAEYARQKGFHLFTSPIEGLGLREEFDGVVSFMTLEHVYNPMSAIKAIYGALKPGGCFLGEVPNQNDWRIQIFDSARVKRLHYDPDHYYYYSPATLTNYLNACGFSNVRLRTVERYRSLEELRDILCQPDSERDMPKILNRLIHPEGEQADRRLPPVNDPAQTIFNRLFERGVDSELMGNVLRFVAFKSQNEQVGK